MRRTLVFLVLAACSSDVVVEHPTKVTGHDDGTVTVEACFEGNFQCDPSGNALKVVHDGQIRTIPFEGTGIEGKYSLTIPLGDPTAGFEIQDGDEHADVFVPEAFELAGVPEHVDGTDTIHLTWTASSSAMKWQFGRACATDSYGGGENYFDDGGRLDISISEILAGAAEPVTPCRIHIDVTRIEDGTVTANFKSRGASGLQRRSFDVEVAP